MRGGVTALAEELVRRRAQLGLSRRIVARRAMISYEYLAQLERGESGRQNPCVRTLYGLARALSVSPQLLAGRAFEDFLETDHEQRGSFRRFG
jgi:transcriptional regulator with XRE-family HTH domain